MARVPAQRIAEKRELAKDARRQAETRTRFRKRMFLGAGGVVVVAALVVLSPPSPGVAFPSLGNTHLAHGEQPHVDYNSQPASSGPHIGVLAEWGEASEPLPPELYVHNLEDGGIVLTYACQQCDVLVGGLRTVLEERGGRIVLTEVDAVVDDAGGSHQAAAVAWGRVLFFDELGPDTRDTLDSFVGLYEGVDHHVRSGGGHN